MAKDIQREIERLRADIRRHDFLYYSQQNPEISDTEYDALLRRLLDIEKAHPEYVAPDSPTQRVGGFTPTDFSPVPHSPPMLSLDNTYNPEEFLQWEEKVRRLLKDRPGEYIVEPKIDGLSLSLLYRNGLLETAATRGDGETGENVTPNVKTIRAIPLKLRGDAPPLIEIRGEAYMKKTDFARLNEAEIKAGREPFANPRNAAAGSLRQKDSKITAQRPLLFFAHSMGRSEGTPAFETHADYLSYVKNLGLAVPSLNRTFSDAESLIAYYRDFEAKRPELPYEVDGLVVKVNRLAVQAKLGATAKSPRWAIAFKYASTQATTVVLSVEFSVGRTGAVTPVAQLEPVPCGGVTISSASLHNFEEVERLGLHRGDTVLIERAGEVIPHVVKVIPAKRPKTAVRIAPPSDCPSCGGKLIREEGLVALSCINPSCPAQLKRGLLHFAGRDAMDIEGLGEAIVDQLVDLRLAVTFADLYRLKKEELLKLDLFGDKKAQNLLAALEESKAKPLSRLLYALGIRHVGKKMSYALAGKFKTLKAFQNASIEELSSVEEVGPVVAASIHAFFRQAQAGLLMEDLERLGLNFKEPRRPERPAESSLAGKIFVFTGELESMSRSEAENTVRKLGAEAGSSVTKKTSWVVVGKAPGSKADKAKRLGIPLMAEAEFLKAIRP